MKYNVLFNLVTSGPHIQWCESCSEFLIVLQTFLILSSLCASVYVTHSAQTAFIFFFQMTNFQPFINRKTIKQIIKLLLILECLMKCNFVFKTFLNHIPPLFPQVLALIDMSLTPLLWANILSLNCYCPFPPVSWELYERKGYLSLFSHFWVQCLTHIRHSTIWFQKTIHVYTRNVIKHYINVIYITYMWYTYNYRE